jgi:hypothetical protein
MREGAEAMTIAEKLEHLAAIARANPGDKSAVRWRLMFLLDELDERSPGAVIDDMLGTPRPPKCIPLNLEKAA